jgi:hypothetical protein
VSKVAYPIFWAGSRRSDGFALATELLPLPVGSRSQLNNAAPSIQPHLQDFPLYYELLRPCAPHRYSDPCGSSRSDVSLYIGTTEK